MTKKLSELLAKWIHTTSKMKITKNQLRQMIREALSFTDAETKHMADAYIKRFIDKPQMPKQGDEDYKEKLEALLADPAVLAKAIKFTPGKNMEDKKDAIIKTLGSQFNQDFYHINKAAVEVIKRYGESK